MQARTRWIPIVAAAVLVALAFAAIPQWLMRDPDAPRRERVRRAEEPEGCPPPDATFEQHPFVVRGRVADDRGEPVEAEVTVIGLESLGPRVRGSKSGRFRVGLKAVDVVRVGVAADGFRSHVSERIEVAPGREVDLGAVALARGEEIAGLVVDEAGAGVPDALLSLEPDEGVLPEGWAEFAAATARWDRTRTDRYGAFRFDGLPAGRWRLRIRAGARGDDRGVVLSGVRAGTRDVRAVVPNRLVARRYGVRVRVFGPDGELVPGAGVWVSHPFDTVRSGRPGSVMDVEAFEPGPTWVVARDPVDDRGRALPWGPAAVRLDPSRRSVDVVLPRREGARGRVTDEVGEPVAATLFAEGRLRADGGVIADGTAVADDEADDDGAHVGEDWVRLRVSFASEGDGGFRLASLPPGRLRLRAEGWRVVTPSHLEAGSAPVEVRLRRLPSVGFRVEAPAGTTLDEVSLRLLRQRFGGDVLETTFTACGSSGTFDVRRSVATDGPYAVEVRATAAGRTLRLGTLRDLRPGDEAPTLRLEDGASVDGIVVRADGSSAPDALVRAFPRSAPTPEVAPPRARAGADGAFRIGGIEPGPLRLVATTRGETGVLDLTPDSSHGARVRVVVAPSRSITARLEGTEAGVEGFRVAAFDAGGDVALADVEGPTADGHVVVGPLPEGTTRLLAWNAADLGDARHAWSEPVENGARDVPLRLTPGARLRGRVLDRDGAPVEAATVVVRGAGWTRTAVTAADGTFAVAGLPPGERTVEARGRAPLDVVVDG